MSNPFIGFDFLIWILKISERLHTKIHVIILLLRQVGCMCTNRNLFVQTGPQNLRIIHFMFGGRSVSRYLKNSNYPQSKSKECSTSRIFSSNKSVPANKKKRFYTSRLPKNEEIGCIFVFGGLEL
jgi:hypothetical protein